VWCPRWREGRNNCNNKWNIKKWNTGEEKINKKQGPGVGLLYVRVLYLLVYGTSEHWNIGTSEHRRLLSISIIHLRFHFSLSHSPKKKDVEWPSFPSCPVSLSTHSRPSREPVGKMLWMFQNGM
jgi:hypothetical protein